MVDERAFDDYRRANDGKVDLLTGRLAVHTAEEKVRDAELLEKIETLTTNVEALLRMWEQAKGIVNFVKILSALVGGTAAALVFLSTYFKWK